MIPLKMNRLPGRDWKTQRGCTAPSLGGKLAQQSKDSLDFQIFPSLWFLWPRDMLFISAAPSRQLKKWQFPNNHVNGKSKCYVSPVQPWLLTMFSLSPKQHSLPPEWWLKAFYQKYLLRSTTSPCRLQLKMNSAHLTSVPAAATWNRGTWNGSPSSPPNDGLLQPRFKTGTPSSFSITKHTRIIYFKTTVFFTLWSSKCLSIFFFLCIVYCIISKVFSFPKLLPCLQPPSILIKNPTSECHSLLHGHHGPKGPWRSSSDCPVMVSSTAHERSPQVPEQLTALRQWFSTFSRLQPLTAAPQVEATPPPATKLFSLLLHNCKCATVMNHNVHIWYFPRS